MDLHDKVLEEITRLKKKAPVGWAGLIAKKMGKEPVTIYAYAGGRIGKKSGNQKEVLKYLKELVAEDETFTENLISDGKPTIE